ncbi:MAG: T9SS type A sorting domain-containing protein [Chlorobi bacterium]|nr:T9SS type A sorting domain-containing protein [Chlorobiota bacterium]
MKNYKYQFIRYIFLVLIFCPLIALGQSYSEYDHNGITRQYILYKPVNLPQNAPLVFVLHGYTGNAVHAQNAYGMNAVADANDFAVCYPQGTKDNNEITHWNARLKISTTDDIGFLSELAGYLQTEHSLNPDHTFVCGMSNGGFMSYTLACEASDVFSAIASVTGTMSGYTWNNCDPAKPIPILEIHGVDDETVPIDGSLVSYGGWGGAPHLDKVVEFWAEKNACTISDSVFLLESTHAYYYRNGINNNEVWYHKIDNHGHSWPGRNSTTGTNASELIWKFFKLVVDKPSSIVDSSSKNSNAVSVYPNPASTFINVKTAEKLACNYKILNILGNCVLSGSVDQTNFQIDISLLSPGFYLLVIDGTAHRILKGQ